MKLTSTKKHQAVLAVILSFFLSGLGQIYLGKVAKGLILILSFFSALVIIWFAVHESELRIAGWDDKQLMFSPSKKTIHYHGYTVRVADIMKITGAIQLTFTWIYSIADAWWESRN
jgi:hypothetical protein